MNVERVREEDFDLHAWYATIPMSDDVYLGLQAQNIARVEMSVIRQWEREALDEQEVDPGNYQGPKYRELMALSQMWVFGLYEFLRTWRQRARVLIQFEDNYLKLASQQERDAYLQDIVNRAKSKARLATRFPVYYPEHVGRISDTEFMKSVRAYLVGTAQLYEELSAVRMPAAKHELPKQHGLEAMIADGPGMGLPSPYSGSIGWQVVLGDKETTIVRRDLADKFFGILSWHEDVETALVLAKQAKDRRSRLRRQVARWSRKPASVTEPLDQYFRTEREVKQDHEQLRLRRGREDREGRGVHPKKRSTDEKIVPRGSRTLPLYISEREPLPYFVREPGLDAPGAAALAVKKPQYPRERRR